MKTSKLILLSLIATLGIGMAACGPTTSEPTSEPTTVDPTTVPTTETTTTPEPTTPDGPVAPPSYDEDAVWFHYHRPEHDYEEWGLWLWEVSKDESVHYAFDTVFEFNGRDDYGAICAQPLSLWSDLEANKIGIIVRDGAWNKDPDGDRFIDIADYTKDENGIYHIYLVSGDYNIYDSTAGKDADIINSAAFVSTKRILVRVNHALEWFKFYENDVLFHEVTVDEETTKKTADVSLQEEGNFDSTYKCEMKFRDSGRVLETLISTQPLFKTDKFKNAYTYDGELGAIYTPSSTTFRVWSPVSTEIKLNIYEVGSTEAIDPVNGSNDKVTYTMTKGEKGVFEYTLEGDLNGKYYTYSVTNPTYKNREIVDPYAKSAGANGRRGMIIDFNDERALPEGWNDANWDIHPRTEMAVWETHVADVTHSSTWTGTEANRGLFNGLVEKGTTYTEDSVTVKTGYDHIKELGANTVQLVPVYDQDNNEINKSFNWGYNPLNYNVIEGSYSSNPHDGYVRVKEFRNLVKTFNEDGINIIMDVVYNHVSSLDMSNFNILMPGYYFRYSGTTPSSGSGCGNDTASEMPMFRKFIKDSTLFLAETYKLSGFRFDLMGLHDVETMNQVVDNLQENYNEDIVVWGEPWNLTTSTLERLATQNNMSFWDDFGGFNDGGRDAIKGSVFDATSVGWATDAKGSSNGSRTKVQETLLGYTPGSSKDPSKSIAYVSCHDNNTLFDKLKLSVTSFDNDKPIVESEIPAEELENAAKLSVFASSIVFTAQGTSFMNAGDEILRTKVLDKNAGDPEADHLKISHNSYNTSYKSNEIDYSRKIAHADVFAEYQRLYDLKINAGAFNYATSEEVKSNAIANETNDQTYIDISTIASDGSTEYRIIYVSANASQNNTLDLSGYTLNYSTFGAYTSANLSSVKLIPGTTLVLTK